MNGDWEPLWIGPPSHRLYAAFHPVSGVPGVGVVIVPPLFHEQPRSRRFITEMAAVLSSQGLPILRFDFHGTGDSSGSGDDTNFATLRRDVGIAVHALRQKAPIRRVCLLAWRGSALALHAGADGAGDADLVVLWEPIMDGADWLTKLVGSDIRERSVRPPPRPGVPRSTDQSGGQLMGFSASPALRADLEAARIDESFEMHLPIWAVQRAGHAELPIRISRSLVLPGTAPGFNDEAAMDATFYLTPQVRDVVGQLGRALQSEAFA